MKEHSARVKNKNFKLFAGKPLFKWILETILSIKIIEKVIINTDAKAILESNDLRQNDKIKIIERPYDLRGDEVSMNKIIKHDISLVNSETYLMTHTTNPLLSAKTIDASIDYYSTQKSKGADSLFTVNKHQTRFYTVKGDPVNHDPNKLLPTQELEPWYEENSNLYIFSRKSFHKNNARIGSNPVMFETPPLESADIDDQTGWTRAEIYALYKQMLNVQS